VRIHARRICEKVADHTANLLNCLIYYTGLSSLLRTQDKVYLLYHRVSTYEVVRHHYGKGRFVTDQQFEKQMRLLSRINDGRVSITFDDGYKDNFLYAYPILKKYGQKAIFFISSGFINGDYFHSADIVDCYVKKRGLTKKESKKLRRAMRQLSLSQRNEFIATLGVEATELTDDSPMTWADLRILLEEGHIIGNHTVNHPVLSKEGKTTMAYEIGKCNEDLREKLHVECKLFAYPYGKMKDIPPGIEGILSENGIDYAFTTVRGCFREGDDPFLIERMPIHYGNDLATLANKCYGINIENGLPLKALSAKLTRLFHPPR